MQGARGGGTVLSAVASVRAATRTRRRAQPTTAAVARTLSRAPVLAPSVLAPFVPAPYARSLATPVPRHSTMAGTEGLVFRQLFEKESSTYTYLLADAETKEVRSGAPCGAPLRLHRAPCCRR